MLPKVWIPAAGSRSFAAAARAPLFPLRGPRRQSAVRRLHDERRAQVRSSAALPAVHPVFLPIVVNGSRIDFRVLLDSLLEDLQRFFVGVERLLTKFDRTLERRMWRDATRRASRDRPTRRDGVQFLSASASLRAVSAAALIAASVSVAVCATDPPIPAAPSGPPRLRVPTSAKAVQTPRSSPHDGAPLVP